ncbi:MAG TPA: hypothetical protein PLT28_00040 [Saprospiraceae bacterium]|nr:hypothetical protein [Saprospiraceae bacterium]
MSYIFYRYIVATMIGTTPITIMKTGVGCIKLYYCPSIFIEPYDGSIVTCMSISWHMSGSLKDHSNAVSNFEIHRLISLHKVIKITFEKLQRF